MPNYNATRYSWQHEARWSSADSDFKMPCVRIARKHEKEAAHPKPAPPAPRCCSPGTTAIAAGCHGGRWRASGPIRTGCGCRKSCCSRPASRPSGRISRNSWRAGRCRGARPRLAGRRAADVGRARLLFPRPQSACLRGRGAARSWRCVSRYRGRPAIAAGDRALYRRGDRRDRLRPPHHAGRRQYRARGVAAVRGGGAAAAGQAADPATGGDAARRRRREVPRRR